MYSPRVSLMSLCRDMTRRLLTHLFILLFMLGLIHPKFINTETDADTNSKTDFMALRGSLFSDFSADLRPVHNRSNPIIVNVSLFVFNIHALNEREQKLTISAWFYLEWMDAFLQWNESKHNGLSDIILSKQDVWTPDLKIFNGYEGLLDITDYGKLVRLTSTGAVIFEPGSAFELYCLVDITYYPFDRQNCSIVIMFWMSRISEADMRLSNEDYVFRALRPNGEWDIEFAGARHYVQGYSDDHSRRYAYLEYTFHLVRKRTFYVLHYLVPVTLLSMLNSVVFVLPPESGEKMSLSITVLLSFTLFISLLNSSLPQTSLHVSLFAVYLSVLLGIGTISVILSAIGLYLHYHNEDLLPDPMILPRSASIRRAIFKRRSAQSSTVPGSPKDVDIRNGEYLGPLLTRNDQQRIREKNQCFGMSFPDDVFKEENMNSSSMNKNVRPGSQQIKAGNNRLISRGNGSRFWCIDPHLFDKIGFCVSLFMTLGSTFSIIILLASH